ncbi:hypothetical protein [Cronobacter sakazakii]|uniref:hypothetical protein n=1 Tax=Cronobacter sakazakii TaxID=28141 RepID=UPI00209B84EC|nr:hypothetical protein [Cronobacter sakazakii]
MMVIAHNESAPNYQDAEEALDQVKKHFSNYDCIVKTDDYGDEIVVRFPETKSHNLLAVIIDKKNFNRKSRLKEHLEFIERQLKENGRI